MSSRLLLLLFCFFTITPFAVSANEGQGDLCPMVRIEPERLPDLTMPRSGHRTFYVNGELTVVGGHTTNFVPTSTSEYFADGKWHQMTMAYTHDNGFAVVLRSGEVIIGGGHTEPLGIGQTFMVERYNPEMHTFEGFGCLDRRRVLANATQLADGEVIIAGNHYATDGIGCYDGRSQVEHIKNVVQGRSNPYILPIANDDAIIIGGNDQYDQHPDTVWADRVKGEAFRVPLLEQWYLVYTDQPFSSNASSIGNCNYLLTATDKSGQLGIVMMSNKGYEPVDETPETVFSLMSTTCPIPMQGPFGPIFYNGPVVVDSLRQRGYVMGVDSLYQHQYILAINYAQQPADLTLYYTDSIGQATTTIPVVTPDGDLILAGGIPNDNYKPRSTVWLYHFGTAPSSSARHSSLIPCWLWIVFVVMGIGVLAYILLIIHRRKSHAVVDVPVTPAPDETDNKAIELMERISQLMDEEQLFRNSELKAVDIADALGTNSRYVTDCIKECRNMTFTQFVNDYRIRYVQQLLRQHPDRKIVEAYTEAGFASERSFFRIFKEATSMTTSEWVSQNVG